MKLNWVESLAMNNAVRSYVQRRVEGPGLAALAPRGTEGAQTLVLGCGRGVDIEIAFDQFHADRVTAIDLDHRQVARARRRMGSGHGDRLRLEVGDAGALPYADATFDLVLDFGIIHHVPRWQDVVGEIQRVLRPGGQFLFEEIPGSELDTLIYRVLTRHPRKNRFDASGFKAECERRGLEIGERLQRFRILVFRAFRGAATKL
jgi:ubiquinone/menaquinone biosynthesis C-methylase UbiE